MAHQEVSQDLEDADWTSDDYAEHHLPKLLECSEVWYQLVQHFAVPAENLQQYCFRFRPERVFSFGSPDELKRLEEQRVAHQTRVIQDTLAEMAAHELELAMQSVAQGTSGQGSSTLTHIVSLGYLKSHM